MLVAIPIRGRVEQADLFHQPRLGVAEPLVFETLIQRGRARLDVISFRILEHTLQERDTSDVISRCFGDTIGSSAIVGVSIDKIDETTSARGVCRDAFSKHPSAGRNSRSITSHTVLQSPVQSARPVPAKTHVPTSRACIDFGHET